MKNRQSGSTTSPRFFRGPRTTCPGWDHKVKNYLNINEKMIYDYDFGDGWRHMIEYEGSYDKQSGLKYPQCTGGERACPPEDVGGPSGYYRFLTIIQDPSDEDHESMLTWAGGHYDPDAFDPQQVRFDDPRKRWKRAFEGCGL